MDICEYNIIISELLYGGQEEHRARMRQGVVRCGTVRRDATGIVSQCGEMRQVLRHSAVRCGRYCGTVRGDAASIAAQCEEMRQVLRHSVVRCGWYCSTVRGYAAQCREMRDASASCGKREARTCEEV